MIEVLFYYLLAAILALIEIEIEGKYGWAERIPTPYLVRGRYARLWGIFQGGRPLTIYHLYTTLLTLLIAHLPFAGIIGSEGIHWNIQSELIVISMFFVWITVWDFLWFVFNPHYGVKNFKRNNIWWHTKNKWVKGIFPVDYLSALLLSLMLAVLASISGNEYVILTEYIKFVASFLMLIIVTIKFVAPRYMKLYKKSRDLDERKSARIFHNLEQYAGLN